jgi:hypothetical protein
MEYSSPLSAKKKGPYKRVAPLQEGKLVIIYYLSVSEIWPDKGAAFGGSGLIRGGLTFILSVSEIWPDKRGGLWWEWPYNMGPNFYS